MFVGIPVGIDEGIAMLDQQPFIFPFAALDANEDEAATQFLAEEFELEVAFGELLVSAEIALDFVRAFIPDNDFATAVLPLGNGAFKFAVIIWMIFDLNREALVGRIHRRAFGHGPGFEDTVQLQAKVVVQ